eukprot:766983-Hanusia_phi.AAC.1
MKLVEADDVSDDFIILCADMLVNSKKSKGDPNNEGKSKDANDTTQEYSAEDLALLNAIHSSLSDADTSSEDEAIVNPKKFLSTMKRDASVSSKRSKFASPDVWMQMKKKRMVVENISKGNEVDSDREVLPTANKAGRPKVVPAANNDKGDRQNPMR